MTAYGDPLGGARPDNETGTQQRSGHPGESSAAPARATEPFWYGQGGGGSGPGGGGSGPGGAQPPSGMPAAVSTAPTGARTSGPRRLTELTSVALLAALLASGTTYAVTEHNGTQQAARASTGPLGSASPGAAPVLQANASAPDWSATAAAVAPSVVAISVKTAQGGAEGSGVIIDNQAHVVTNNHVVASLGSNAQIRVTLNDKRSYAATIVGTDPSTDLAVLKLQNPPADLSAIALGAAEKLKVGQPVMAVGNPLGLAGTVTTGIVSALNRPVSTSPSGGTQDPFGQQAQPEPVVTNAVQTSAAINPGNSGGALVDASGRLIGINSSIASLGSSSGSSGESGNIGIGFAIPVSEVTSIAKQLIASGKAQHAYLGVSSADATVKDGAASRAAAQVTKVSPGTPAAKAGLRNGDAVIAVDGDSVDSSLSLVGQIRQRQIGDAATLTIVRGGVKKDLSVTLASRPSQQ